jgi:hypothetical protein
MTYSDPQLITIQPDPGFMNQIASLAQIMIGKEMMSMLVSSLGIAAMTFGILDLFMTPGLSIKIDTRLKENEGPILRTSLCLLLFTLLPAIIGVSQLFESKSKIMNAIPGALTMFGISIAACWLFSRPLKHFFPEETKGKNLLLLESVGFIFRIVGNHMVGWIQKLVVGFVSGVIRVFHVPFITQYYIWAPVLNLALSFVLISVMGSSKDAGFANLLGSVFAGTAHYFFIREKINQLKS